MQQVIRADMGYRDELLGDSINIIIDVQYCLSSYYYCQKCH